MHSPKNFSALFLDKKSAGQETANKSAAPARVDTLADTAMGRVGGHTCDEKLDRASLNPTKTFSETVLRAAQPSVHRRCNRRLNAAARYLSAEQRRKLK